ncbi:efflux RND transporter periplasmic adaptor subunit [Adhaeribacter sp. BT258]|uniref:Efflux RND transporter periplasmic adaptor subunit n=2 Tax=Adhaeribacter terrigena TaxID=2793070 RepID=A0ABS1BXW2_9BACT|nr:efflux RND transporter periplasmic adaptor subunit [Adhaeribacter terrigena]
MTLIKVDGSASKTETGIMLTDQQRKLANIQTYKVVTGKIGDMSTLTGEVVLNQNATESITARVPGRIEKLMVWSIGEKVRKGQPLYQIYSEQLLAAQQEYLLALQQESINLSGLKQDLAASSRQKLLLWGMTNGQINQLAKTGKASPRVTYYSPVSGNITELAFREGSYVMEGSVVFQVSDLTAVWVQAQLYPGETGLQFQKENVRIVAEAYPKDTLAGQLVLNSPVLETNRQVNLATFKVDNMAGKLKPGMLAYVLIRQPLDAGIMVPKSAIIPGDMPMVWVENKDGSFEPRMVKTGSNNKDWVEINSGLKGEELVVSEGAYLLNSEYILKKGNDPMAGHNH